MSGRDDEVLMLFKRIKKYTEPGRSLVISDQNEFQATAFFKF